MDGFFQFPAFVSITFGNDDSLPQTAPCWLDGVLPSGAVNAWRCLIPPVQTRNVDGFFCLGVGWWVADDDECGVGADQARGTA